MNNRVVITGLGVVAPNGVGIPAFRDAGSVEFLLSDYGEA
jgi:hypothetical protein